MPAVCNDPKASQPFFNLSLQKEMETPRPPSTTWPSSFTTCTGEKLEVFQALGELARRFLRRNPALGSVSSEDGRRWSCLALQSVVTALNKKEKMGKQQLVLFLGQGSPGTVLLWPLLPQVAPGPPVVAAGPWDSGHPALPETPPNEPTHNLLQSRCSAWKLPPGRGLMALSLF